MKPCKCGCGELITEKDNWGRNHDYKLGHGTKGKYHFWNAVGNNHYNWKGGRRRDIRGYIMIKCKHHPRARADRRYKLPEHDIIMERHIGRYLQQNEIVHHINGVKDDNRIENLELLTRKTHPILHNKRDPISGRFTR